MSIDRVREVAHRLLVSTGALAAFGAALELQIASATVAPQLEAQIREVLYILGVDAELEGVSTEALVALLAEIRLTFLQGVKLLYSSTLQPGWTHTEEELLQSQGQVSAAFAPMFQRVVIPQLDGLAARLEAPTASFLDVGVGVAALSIAMARLWPALQVVGIDPWEPALALARQNVAAAGLGDRIELRCQAVEDLAESAEFDLVWFSPPSSVQIGSPRRCNTCGVLCVQAGGSCPGRSTGWMSHWRLRLQTCGRSIGVGSRSCPQSSQRCWRRGALTGCRCFRAPPGQSPSRSWGVVRCRPLESAVIRRNVVQVVETEVILRAATIPLVAYAYQVSGDVTLATEHEIVAVNALIRTSSLITLPPC